MGDFFFYIGAMLGLGSGLPILFSRNLPVLAKVILLPVYYLVGLFVVFFLGWMSLCWFCPSCH